MNHTAKCICAAVLMGFALCGCEKKTEEKDTVSASEPVSEAFDAQNETVADEQSESVTEGQPESVTEAKTDAVFTYKGIDGWGSVTKDEVLSADFDGFVFECDGETLHFSIRDTEDYAIRNILKDGKNYYLVTEDGVITGAKAADEMKFLDPVVKGTPGQATVLNLLKTAAMPLGSTLYMYGGGWNFQDESASYEAMTIGVPLCWSEYFESVDAFYNFRYVPGTDSTDEDPENSIYPFGSFNAYQHCGLDCSGYVGWILYNTLNAQSSTDFSDGFVFGSTGMAQRLDETLGYGTTVHELPNGVKMLPGDLFSMRGHVYMVVGSCDDGSVVILHSASSSSRQGEKGGGVQLSALDPMGRDKDCEAYRLAEAYMTRYYPDWSDRYEVLSGDYVRYTDTSADERCGLFSWDTENGPLSDEEGIRQMDAAAVLAKIYE